MITGGSRGIGRACVELIASGGESRDQAAEVVFTYNTQKETADTLVESLTSQDLKVRAIPMNLLDSEATTAVITDEIKDHGPFDGVVHNAAITDDAAFYFMDAQQWHNVLNVSLNSFFILNKAVLPHMVRKRWGRIVAIASVAGEAGNRGQTNYAAAKGAVIAATKSLAREVGSKGVIANIVSPGIIETDMTKDLPEEDLRALIPMGRFGRPEEVAHVVRFLLSEHASYVNGAVIRVNGGMYT